jgi:hypothetical protein
MRLLTYIIISCLLAISSMCFGQSEQKEKARWDVGVAVGYQDFSMPRFGTEVLDRMKDQWGLEKTEMEGGYKLRAGIYRTKKRFEQSLEFNYLRNGVDGQASYQVFHPEGDLTTTRDFKYIIEAKTVSYGIGIPLVRASNTGDNADPKKLIVTVRGKLGLGFASYWRKYEHVYYSSGETEPFETGINDVGILSGIELEANKKLTDRFAIGAVVGLQSLSLGDHYAQNLANYWEEDDGVSPNVEMGFTGFNAAISFRYSVFQ